MTRIAILGGGISGLTAAYELELARRNGAPIDWRLYEASDRLGGIVETTRHTTPKGDFILEGGPDAWVSEKPWARDLAIELGLEADLIYSNDATRKTYIVQQGRNTGEIAGKLQPIPDRMRLMVPEDLSALENSPFFSDSARAAYANELANAAQLKAASPFADPAYDESVATFVLRHFGEEVLTQLAAPLLSGVFGGDVAKLSVRAVMPAFVAMERDHGSLIAALQAKSSQRAGAPQPIFTSLLNGMTSLIDALVAQLPAERLHLNMPVIDIGDENRWFVIYDELRRADSRTPKPLYADRYDHVMLATPLDVTSELLRLAGDHSLRTPLPVDASSAILATLCWSAETARTFAIPPGFGFLLPDTSLEPTGASEGHDFSRAETTCNRSGALAPEVRLVSLTPSGATAQSGTPQRLSVGQPRLLACTFVNQKFPHRAPAGARVLRAFFGGPGAEALSAQSNETIAAAALTQLQQILGPLPAPDSALTTVRRWPRSLPQYEVGHLDRMAQLDALVATIPGLTLLGNSYRGVGLPDLIRDARKAARGIAEAAAATPQR